MTRHSPRVGVLVGLLGASLPLVASAAAPSPEAATSASPTATVAVAAIPPDTGPGASRYGFNAFLVIPGPGVVAAGTTGSVSMAEPWGGIAVNYYDGTSPNATHVCAALSNVGVFHLQGGIGYFDISCGGTMYRVNFQPTLPALSGNPGGALYDGGQWTLGTTVVNTRWNSQGEPWSWGTAQVCFATQCSQRQGAGGQVGQTVTTFSAQAGGSN